jgi:fumarate hydratase subunit alpha
LSANFFLPADVLSCLKTALRRETGSRAKNVIRQIIENAEIARKEKISICQDTGTAIVFVEIGQSVRITGGLLDDAVNQGVRRAYRDGYFRNSIVSDPLDRKNTGDNTPAVIHTEIVPGDKLKISVIAKGGGSENMSALKIFPPSAGIEDIKQFVVDTVKNAGANACPPLVIGIGIGGTFDTVGLLAKKALLRALSSGHHVKKYAKIEKDLLAAINKTGIGPMALGGKTTALAVLIEAAPTHITSLPVAVNLQCHAVRRNHTVL